MYWTLLLTIVHYFLRAECQQRESKGTYYSIKDDNVFEDEVMLLIPDISLVQCIFKCRSEPLCSNVAMNEDLECLLLNEELESSDRISNLTQSLRTRVRAKRVLSVISPESPDENTTIAENGTFDNGTTNNTVATGNSGILLYSYLLSITLIAHSTVKLMD